MIKRRIVTSLLLIVALLTLSTASVSAYNICGYNWSNKSIKFYYDSFNSTRFKNMIDKAASVWNASGIDASLTYQSGSGAYCVEGYYPNATWDGISYISWSNYLITSATLVLNTGISVTWNNDNALQSVAVHEFGHIICLDENYPLECVMNTNTWGELSRFGHYRIITPKPIDVAAVNSVY